MAVEFLADAQAAYGRFDDVPSRADLERFFLLDDDDKTLIGDRRGDHNRLGFVLQATTVRYLGVFLEDPLDVPWPVVEYLADQLGIADASCVKRYTARVTPVRLYPAARHRPAPAARPQRDRRGELTDEPPDPPARACLLAGQAEIYFSIVQRKVISPDDFTGLDQIRDRLAASEIRCNAIARPFNWKFTRTGLDDLLHRIDARDKTRRRALAA